MPRGQKQRPLQQLRRRRTRCGLLRDKASREEPQPDRPPPRMGEQSDSPEAAFLPDSPHGPPAGQDAQPVSLLCSPGQPQAKVTLPQETKPSSEIIQRKIPEMDKPGGHQA